jgi:hypothetical protein
VAEQIHGALVYVYRERLRRANGSGYAQGAGMNYESAVFTLATFFIAGSVFAGIVYCVILIKELWQKNRGGRE